MRLRSAHLAIVAIVVVVGVFATVVAWRQADRSAADQERNLARTITASTQSTALNAIAGLGGGAALVQTDGTLDIDAFAAYQADVETVTSLQTLAWVPAVRAAERAAFEDATGIAIVDRVDDTVVPSPVRAVYYPIGAIAPQDPANAALLGVDLGVDPITSEAMPRAVSSGAIVITQALAFEPDAPATFFIVKPLYREGTAPDTPSEREASVVGFLASVYDGAGLQTILDAETPSGVAYVVRDGDVVLASTESSPARGRTQQIEVGGRTWTVTVDDTRFVAHTLTWFLAAITVLLAAGILLVNHLETRNRRSIALAARRATELAELAEGLAAATTMDEVSEVITDRGRRPVNAKTASIGVIDHAAGVLRVRHGKAVTDDMARRYASPALELRLVFTDAARTGAAVYVPNWETYQRLYPDTDPANAQLGRGARAALPVRSGDRVVGAIVFSWESSMEFDAATIATLTTIAETASQTIARAQLVESIQDNAQRNELVAELAQSLANARTVTEIYAVVEALGPGPVDAVVAHLAFLRSSDNQVEVRPHPYFDPALTAAVRTRPLDADLPGPRAIRTQQMVLLASLDDARRDFPAFVADSMSASDLGASVHIPLTTGAGERLGSLAFGWTSAQQFTPTVLATIRTIAELCVQTIERARLAEAEHDLVSTLQNRVVTPLTPMPGLAMAQQYLPAAHALGMGGDWYEGMPLGTDRYALIMGDVAGHGISAVAEMTHLRAIIAALVGASVPLGELFPRVTELLRSSDELVTATALVMVVDLRTDTLTYVYAGHPPALLRHPDGRVEVLDGGRQALLGTTIDAIEPATAPFPPGAALIAYTDGLIERRHEPLDVSIDRLAAAVADAPTSGLPALAAHVVAASLAGAEPEDDIALTILERMPVLASEDPGFALPAPDAVLSMDVVDASEVAACRHAIADVLHPAPRELVDTVVLVGSELITNALEHGTGAVRMQLVQRDDGTTIAVHDGGAGLPVPQDPGASATHGRGLFIVDASADAWGWTANGSGKWVWARFEIPTRAP